MVALQFEVFQSVAMRHEQNHEGALCSKILTRSAHFQTPTTLIFSSNVEESRKNSIIYIARPLRKFGSMIVRVVGVSEWTPRIRDRNGE